MSPLADKLPKTKKRFDSWQSLAGFLLACTFINALMSFNFPFAKNGLEQLLCISPEAFLLLALLCLGAFLHIPYRKAVSIPLVFLTVFLNLFRVADRLVPIYFNRPFNMYLDLQFFPDLIFLLYTALPLRVFMLGCFSAVCATALIAWGIWWALKTIQTFFDGRRQRRYFAMVAVPIGVLIYICNPWSAGSNQSIFAPGFFHRVAAEIDFILHLSDTIEHHLAAFDEATQKSAQYPKTLRKLKGCDVYLFFIESYGHTIFTDPRHAPRVVPFLRDAQQKLRQHGYLISSHFLRSPAYGGSSWLAHGALSSGVPITSQLRFDLLLTSQVQPIAEYFNRAGYRSVCVMPGTLWPWPAGEFFRYQKKYYAFDFDYQGPHFGWAPMPDQYVIDYIFRAEIERRSQPLFIEFILVSSHAPFNRQPPYVEDWSKIGDGSIYHTLKPIEFPVIWPHLENASEAYATSVVYDLKVLVEFGSNLYGGDALIIILGDHQPNPKITGTKQPWSVPVHVISRNPDFIQPFIQRGFTPGLIPSQPLPHPGIESLLWSLLDDFH
jgi:hypothetical protein